MSTKAIIFSVWFSVLVLVGCGTPPPDVSDLPVTLTMHDHLGKQHQVQISSYRDTTKERMLLFREGDKALVLEFGHYKQTVLKREGDTLRPELSISYVDGVYRLEDAMGREFTSEKGKQLRLSEQEAATLDPLALAIFSDVFQHQLVSLLSPIGDASNGQLALKKQKFILLMTIIIIVAAASASSGSCGCSPTINCNFPTCGSSSLRCATMARDGQGEPVDFSGLMWLLLLLAWRRPRQR